MRFSACLCGLVVACVVAAACAQPTAPSPTTGLTGVVVRGPITPVCQVQAPCDAPFSASFTVEQNGRRVAQFQSDANGRFTVMLATGTYRIVPGSDAPILSPQSQIKSAEVLQGELTEVRLEFDTGIR